jgi:hypothetical protein
MSALIKPLPVPIVTTGGPPPGYVALCRSLGISEPVVALESRVLDFMKLNSIPRLDSEQVDSYMDDLSRGVGKPWNWLILGTAPAFFFETSGRWLSQKPAIDRRFQVLLLAVTGALLSLLIFTGLVSTGLPEIVRLVACVVLILCVFAVCVMKVGDLPSPWRAAAFLPTRYSRPVPMEHLAHMAMLRGEFPELNFFVTDYTAKNPDPFICCTTDGSWHVVFGVWDEPGFGVSP